ncbi:hypothetical protein AaE_005424, partial [Aphanomyces astaci]
RTSGGVVDQYKYRDGTSTSSHAVCDTVWTCDNDGVVHADGGFAQAVSCGKSASKAFIFTTTNDDSLASTDDKASSQLKRRAESAHVPSSRKKPALHKRPSSLFAALSSFQCN